MTAISGVNSTADFIPNDLDALVSFFNFTDQIDSSYEMDRLKSKVQEIFLSLQQNSRSEFETKQLF